MLRYMHIPKTAGTALKNLNKDGYKTFKISKSHRMTLSHLSNVVFGLRDPLQRFCSGFWEAKTFEERIRLSSLPTNSNYKLCRYDHISRRIPKDTKLFHKYKIQTPNDLITRYQNRDISRRTMTRHNFTSKSPLDVCTAPLTYWLGDLEDYKIDETRVKMVIFLPYMSEAIKTLYHWEMPTDPFLSRSRSQFDIPQSYEISPGNKKWFIEHFRSEDYKLVNYIKTRGYYISNPEQMERVYAQLEI